MHYEPQSIVIISLILAVQLFGFATTWLMRATENSSWQSAGQLSFFLALTAVAVTGMICLTLHCNHWVFCAITLSVMVVASTLDLRRTALQSADQF